MRPEYILGAILVIGIALGGAWLFFLGNTQESRAGSVQGTPYVEITNPAGFVNTDGVSIGELVGKKIILVEFLTYSCINCQRSFPHVVSWYSKYRDEGLEIIGIHTPEFAFEKDIDNVRAAMKEFGIEYPIVLDNEYATWNAYKNKYWPRKYLIDIQGNIVYDHIGEGAYEETEGKIRELLAERAMVLGETLGSNAAGPTEAVAATPTNARSPETYFGSLRNRNFGNGIQNLSLPSTLAKDTLYLKGTWNIQPEYAEASGVSEVDFRYDAAKVYLVASSKTPAIVTVLVDGVPVKTIRVEDERLYTVINGVAPESHLLQLRSDTAGLRIYAFTFG